MHNNVLRPTAEIDLSALQNNLSVVRRCAPHSRAIAVVKADAYGHGLVPAARVLASADAFGVARIEEATMLRAAGIQNEIVVLEGFFVAEHLGLAAQHGLQLVVHSFEQIAMLEQYTGPHRFVAWLKTDTGMNRLGFRSEELSTAHARLSRCAAVGDLRLMTHLADAEAADGANTKRQLERFNDLARVLKVERSIANSAGVLAWPETRVEWVRAGLMLYGISPFPDRNAASLGLRPAMKLSTRVIAVKRVLENEAIGYGGTWRAPRDSRIAVAAIGYGDGYPRGVQMGTPVIINGCEMPIVGRVSMDMITVDVTGGKAEVGDEVILWGQGLPVERIATFAGTISYELVSRLSARVAKILKPA